MSRRSVQTLILMVDNEFGVLTRVTSLVRREGWNIKSLVVAETMNPAVSRLTLSVECIDSTLQQVLDRMGKLACVRGIKAYSDATHLSRELVMVTVGCEKRAWAEEAAKAIGAKVVGSCGECLTIEFTGEPEHADNLISALKPFGIVNIARSGVVALEKPTGEEGT
jgi:acetolactate synthase I/III small subunit